ncbi:MAG: CoA transferase [Dehalococcoidia bacterium]|nr:CoA transferase [Dehalococcoidia bacterium]
MSPGNACLEGIRVVEFAQYRAGPHCGAMLAALGAEVVKVESMARPDFVRYKMRPAGQGAPVWDAPPQPSQMNWRFDSINMGKGSIRLNLKAPGALDVVRGLAEVSDVFLGALAPGVLERLGLGYEQLRRWRPDIILISLSAAGSTGPEGRYRGFAPTFAAAAGLSHCSGYADGPPMEFSGSMDNVVGSYALLAALAALAERERTGRGQHADIAANECVAAALGSPLLAYLSNGTEARRDGNRRPGMAPSNCYKCKDAEEWVSIVVGTDAEWQALCRAIGAPDMASDVRLATAAGRKAHEDEIDRRIGVWTAQRGAYGAMQGLQEAGVAASPSFRTDQLFRDPHLAARQAWVRLEHPHLGTLHEVRAPWVFADATTRHARGPLFGEDDARVYGGLLGMDAERIAALQRARVMH